MLLSDMKSLLNFKPKRSALERPPRDGLPVLMRQTRKKKGKVLYYVDIKNQL